jgi:CheY-like chemotaxis protein/anti-sigma regulatory factor (Ser/Thr protein kinase)
MTTVLVVDDSAVDRRLVGGLLEKDAELKVRYAVDGADAQTAMSRGPVDLVVTDLVMPGMDGLQLVAAIRITTPHIPVILMTSKGSEEIAVRALQEGAASYVPKRVLAQDLLDMVHRVLALSGRQRCHSRLLGRMSRNHCAFVLENDSALISTLVAYLQDSVLQMGLCDDAQCTRIGVALEEALVNALYHGNLEVGSELRGEEDNAFYRVAAERNRQAPYRDRRIHVEAALSRDEAVFTIRDEGPGFDPSRLPDPTDPESLERVSGRGLLLMRAFMDEVTYNRTGNQVTLIKRRSPETPIRNEVA